MPRKKVVPPPPGPRKRHKAPEIFRWKKVPARGKNNWIRRALLPPDHPEHDPACLVKYKACLEKQNTNRARAKMGVPWGWRRGDWDFHWNLQMKKAQKIVTHLKQEGYIEGMHRDESDKTFVDAEAGADLVTPEARAEAALAFNVAVVMTPDLPISARQASSRTVLEWLRAKPVQKSDVTVRSAEQWLADIAEEVE